MELVLGQFAKHGLTVLLAAILLFAGQYECTAKSALAMGQGGCCKHGPCRQSPGTPSHSSCQTAPASAQRAIVTASAEPAAAVRIDCVVDHVAVEREPCCSQAEYTPPDLFVLNSSFLI